MRHRFPYRLPPVNRISNMSIVDLETDTLHASRFLVWFYVQVFACCGKRTSMAHGCDVNPNFAG
jgi:hypothetical protein